MHIEKLFNQKIHSLSTENRVAIAVSGGVDSVALLILTYQWALNGNVKINVLTVNHNLRPASSAECQYVNELAQSLNLECSILSWDEPQAKQNKARAARYQLLTAWCQENKVSQLLLGHHQNDQAETVLLRLARGSGLDGLCAMQELNYNNGIQIIRPLLSFTKEQLIAYLKEKNINWREDPSNKSVKYDRTLFRNYINTSHDSDHLIKRLALTATHMQRTQEAIIFYVKQEIKRCVIENKLGYVDINWQNLLQAPEEIAMRIILACLMIIGNKSYKPRYNNFSQLFTEIWEDKFHQARTLHGCKITKVSNILSIRREVSAISDQEIIVEPGKKIIWDGRFECMTTFPIRACKNHHGSEMARSLPVLKVGDQCIYPFKEELSSGLTLKFIFSELLLNVL